MPGDQLNALAHLIAKACSLRSMRRLFTGGNREQRARRDHIGSAVHEDRDWCGEQLDQHARDARAAHAPMASASASLAPISTHLRCTRSTHTPAGKPKNTNGSTFNVPITPISAGVA